MVPSEETFNAALVVVVANVIAPVASVTAIFPGVKVLEACVVVVADVAELCVRIPGVTVNENVHVPVSPALSRSVPEATYFPRGSGPEVAIVPFVSVSPLASVVAL
jgi:hypothetical protein